MSTEEEFEVEVPNALNDSVLKEANDRAVDSLDTVEARLIGSSPAMARLRERIVALAPLWTPVLISGEVGSGREVVADAVHGLGVTGRWPLLRIDGDAFSPRDVIPTVGAVYIRRIDRLSPEGQRFWSELIHKGESRQRIRLIASAPDPPAAFDRRFGYDARLAETLLRFRVRVPPLRERRQDIAAVGAALVERIGRSMGRPGRRLSPPAVRFLEAQRWQGNSRQLEEVVSRALAFTRRTTIRRELLQEILMEFDECLADMRAGKRVTEREELLQQLRETGGNVSRTAESLGRSRAAVYRLIEKHGIALARCR